MTACLIYKFAESGPLATYVRGKLALGGVDPRVPLATWLDAVYAIVLDAPHQIAEKLHDHLTITAARLRPDRETWGLTPDQIALSSRLTGQKPGPLHAAPKIKRGGFGPKGM